MIWSREGVKIRLVDSLVKKSGMNGTLNGSQNYLCNLCVRISANVPSCCVPEILAELFQSNFTGNDWSGVTLDEFTTCPHNLANNRQTRMLANLSLSGCYGSSPLTRTERDCIMLNSAKDNLAKMAFFGLTEYQVETQYLFEKTFGLKFYENFFQYSHTNAKNVVVSTAQKNRILELNSLDIQLYDFAKKLFFVRLNAAQKEDATNQYLLLGNDKRQLSPIHDDSDYEKADDNYADDDSFVNHRLVKKLRSTDTRVGKQTVHRNRRWTTSK